MVEDMLKEYKLTTERLQSEFSRLSAVVADQQENISALEHKVNVLTEKRILKLKLRIRKVNKTVQDAIYLP